jgi:hypothetical protein
LKYLATKHELFQTKFSAKSRNNNNARIQAQQNSQNVPYQFGFSDVVSLQSLMPSNSVIEDSVHSEDIVIKSRQDSGLSSEQQANLAADNKCYVQTCNQIISGRQLSYNRALEIVQSEEYLDAADTDLIRRLKRLKRQANMGFPILDMFDQALTITEFCTKVISSGTSAVNILIVSECFYIINEICGGVIASGSCTVLNILTNSTVVLSPVYESVCIAYSTGQVDTLCFPTTITVPAPTTESVFQM